MQFQQKLPELHRLMGLLALLAFVGPAYRSPHPCCPSCQELATGPPPVPIATTRQQGAFLQLTPLRRLADDLRTSRPADRRHPGSGARGLSGNGQAGFEGRNWEESLNPSQNGDFAVAFAGW